MSSKIFVNQLIRWYEHNKRELPWRNTKDPYKIWLSEIILQQTRIAQGLPYYERFLEAYPTVHELAAASEEEVLRLWQGLGYYSRARNLHACAKYVSTELNGQFPEEYTDLLGLKGIGKYTAAAISSLAFGKSNAVVDGNVFRVLSRFFGIHDDIADAKTFKIFENKGNELIKGQNPGIYNQAIMDFGAIQCTPKSPSCAICPISSDCFAFNNGLQEKLPLKSKKVKVRNRYFHYLVLEHGGKLLMRQRQAGDIWQGLYDFHNLETSEGLSEEEVLQQVDGFGKLTLLESAGPFKHVLTHQRIFAQFFRLRVNDLSNFVQIQDQKHLKSFSLEQISDLPKPILIQNFLKKYLF